MEQNQSNLELQTTQPATTALANTTGSAPTINLPVLSQPEEIMEATKENLAEGESFRLDKIKMPSGGGLTFERIDESGKPYPAQILKGIILGFKNFKSWYEKSFNEKAEGDDTRPDCFSADTVTGSGCQRCSIPTNQPCASCPKNAWESDRRGGKGKDCADRTRIWLLEEGCAMPVYIDLPKTSISPFKEYRKRLTQKAKVIYGVVTEISLEQDTSQSNIKYSKANFGKVADLTAAERATIKEYINSISNIMTINRDSITDDHASTDNGDDSLDAVVRNVTADATSANEPY